MLTTLKFSYGEILPFCTFIQGGLIEGIFHSLPLKYNELLLNKHIHLNEVEMQLLKRDLEKFVQNCLEDMQKNGVKTKYSMPYIILGQEIFLDIMASRSAKMLIINHKLIAFLDDAMMSKEVLNIRLF